MCRRPALRSSRRTACEVLTARNVKGKDSAKVVLQPQEFVVSQSGLCLFSLALEKLSAELVVCCRGKWRCPFAL